MSKNSSLEDTAVGYNDEKCKGIDAGIDECYSEIISIIHGCSTNFKSMVCRRCCRIYGRV